jgi:hypothetical protein
VSSPSRPRCTFHVGPGTHSGSYSTTYHREQLEGQDVHVRHWDGGGAPAADPVVFDYRTRAADFSIWGWDVSVDREPVEMLNLRDVSCSAITLQGTGRVAVTVPARCRTGVDGSRTFTVDLGPAQATNDPASLGSSRVYGRTATVALSSLHPARRPATHPPARRLAPRCDQPSRVQWGSTTVTGASGTRSDSSARRSAMRS